ncbi:BglG family transcription antiterminator [Sediminibacillus halophilus]|uniref:Ascorbate-specific PTS system EIIA component n=1 Tax=Sediminibacillus halophilus TaxID=482461 RepID=A0A1G9UZY0_9BACI|nr:BglG family transcription antiterminator [Sediminibacillus halophilus]SDM65532.1 Transcriptional antiterminator [Sediminibacillus halophilus]
MDDRSDRILKEILNYPGTTSKQLEKKYNLSRRQLGYSLGKINSRLKENKLPVIERTRQGQFLIGQEVYFYFNRDSEAIEEAGAPVLSEKQRVYLIALMLISREDLSLYHFTSEFYVSKNTILQDLKLVEELVGKFDLSVRYSRKRGYLLEGNEFQVRRLLTYTTNKTLEMVNGKTHFQSITGIGEAEIQALAERVGVVEKELDLKFTDEKLTTMPYILSLVIKRIDKGCLINSFYIKYEELSDTKQYQATEKILSDIGPIPMEERLFITLFLLSTNVYWSGFLTEETIPNLISALRHMLRLFEKRACITLQDKDQLLNKLLLHVKPAYYRIKYQLTEMTEHPYEQNKQLQELHHLVKQSTGPLEELIGLPIPESETSYLTLLIGGWMTRQGDDIRKKWKAIVVCPKGVSVSRMMYSELRHLFPDFIFLDTLSMREFQEYQLDYDIVFSSVPINTTRKLFIANPIMEQEEKERLKKQVMLELSGVFPSDIDIDDLLEVISDHADIRNEKQLATALYQYIHRDPNAAIKRSSSEQDGLTLADLLRPELITLKQTAGSWEEAVRIASGPLLESGTVTEGYVEAMLGHEKDPYIVLAPNMAIPHAAPDQGVRKVGMSMLRLEKGVPFTEDYSIQIIVVIAAVDKKKHLKALIQLMELARSEEARSQIMNADTRSAVHAVIQQYADTYYFQQGSEVET